MLLSFEEIMKITVGAPFIENTEEGIRFYKFSPEVRSAWMDISKTLGQRALSTAGVRFDFFTDSKHININVAKSGPFELYINGILRHTVKDSDVLSFDIADPLGAPIKEARVTVYFPSHTAGTVRALSLDDGAYAKPLTFDKKIFFIGDSITQGWNSGLDSLSYANRVTRYFNADSVIQGVGGAFFAPETLEKIPYDPEWVILAYGTNDFTHFKTFEDFKLKLEEYMKKLSELYGNKKIFVISPTFRFDNKPRASLTFDACINAIAAEAKSYGFNYINGLDLVPPLREFFFDDVHPNDKGFAIYAENLVKELSN